MLNHNNTKKPHSDPFITKRMCNYFRDRNLQPLNYVLSMQV